jgi:hypothetical protein
MAITGRMTNTIFKLVRIFARIERVLFSFGCFFLKKMIKIMPMVKKRDPRMYHTNAKMIRFRTGIPWVTITRRPRWAYL